MIREIDKDAITKIRTTILKAAKKYNIKIYRIILFGSRASEEAKEYSDWDILVTTNEKVDRNTFWHFYIETIRRLREYGIKVDLIIIDRETFERKKNVVNTIANEASEEGVTL